MIDSELQMLATKADKNQASPFQITYFLIGQEPTDQAKLQKCLHEIKTRVKSIRAAQLEIAELSDLVQLHCLEAEKLSNTPEGVIKKRMINRKMESIADQMDQLEDRIKGWEREADQLRQIYKLVNQRSPLKDWNDNQVQMEYWSAKLSQELRTRTLLNMPTDLEVMKTILSLPENSPLKQEVLLMISPKEDK